MSKTHNCQLVSILLLTRTVCTPFTPVDGEVDIETLKEAVTNLSNASMKIGQAIYSKKGDETNPPDNEDADKKKEDTQEAEFTEKKK